MDGEPLRGDARERLVFDAEPEGDCTWLQGERYNVGDRLIVSASAAPTEPGAGEPDVRWFDRVLTWRHEWTDHWTLHGLLPQDAEALSRDILAASTRDAILMLVAPERLPFAIDATGWQVAEPGRERDTLLDAVPWRDGYIALGQRVAARGGRATPAIWRSGDGHRWQRLRGALSRTLLDGARPVELVAFQDRLFLLGADGGTLVAWRSADGERWERILEEPYRDDPPVMDGRTLLPIGSITAAADDDRLVVIVHNDTLPDQADRRVAWTSTDGTSFTRSDTIGLPRSPGRLTATSDRFLMPYSDGSVLASDDGVTWTAAGQLPAGWVDLASDRERGALLATVNTGMTSDHSVPAPGPIRGEVASSVDGNHWSPSIQGPGESGWVDSIEAKGGRIAALGDLQGRTWVLTSIDAGATWTYGELPGVARDGCVVDVVVGTRSTVVIGGCGGPLAWVADR